MDQHHFKGNDIPHIKLDPNMSIEDLVKIYSESGFNGRKLGEAAKVYAKMIKENATICLTASGALAPVGFGGIFKTLIERGFVDWIITTGANVYHEDHFAWGLPVKQGGFQVDDMKLYDMEIVRIRDVFIKFYETLEAQDQVIQKAFKNNFIDKPFTTAEFCNFLGKISSEKYFFDLRGFINKELSNLNIKNIDNIEMDTFSEKEFFYSYRRSRLNEEQDYGRCISVILMT